VAASPVVAAGPVSNVSTGLIPAYTNWSGGDGSLFSTVKFFHHGYRWGGGWYPYYGGSYYGYYPYSRYGNGYGYYTEGNKVCVFSGYGYRCYTPGGGYYYY